MPDKAEITYEMDGQLVRHVDDFSDFYKRYPWWRRWREKRRKIVITRKGIVK